MGMFAAMRDQFPSKLQRKRRDNRFPTLKFFFCSVVGWVCLAAVAWHLRLSNSDFHSKGINHSTVADASHLGQAACLQTGCVWHASTHNCGCLPFQSAQQVLVSGGSDEQRRICPARASKSSNTCGSPDISKAECLDMGCCWAALGSSDRSACVDPSSAAPWETYRVVWSKQKTGAAVGVPKSQQLQLQLTKNKLPELGPDFVQLQVKVDWEAHNRLHFKVTAAGAQRWEVPQSLLPRPRPKPFNREQLLYDVVLPEVGEPFSIAVARSGRERQQFGPEARGRWWRGRHVFNTTGFGLVFKDQYLELTTSLLKATSLYGFGQHSSPDGSLQLPRNGQKLVLWNADTVAASPGVNQYGSHPFYLQVDQDGLASGVLLLNSNGLEVTLQPESLTFRAIGGVLEFYIFLGPQLEAVLQQYHHVVGRPAMPPYWSLGFHQSKWGYKTLDDLKEVVESYRAAGLPLEAIWSDIDYMEAFSDFTFNSQGYPRADLRRFVHSLRASGQRWLPILDCGIPAKNGNPAFASGMNADVFIRDALGAPYLGQVWPGAAVFPDFLSRDNTWPWWSQLLQEMHQQVPFDGLWLDMNEPANFCSGESCRQPQQQSLLGLLLGRRALLPAAIRVGLTGLQDPDASGQASAASRHSSRHRPPQHHQQQQQQQDAGQNASEVMEPWMQELTTCNLVCLQPRPADNLAYPPYAIQHGITPKPDVIPEAPAASAAAAVAAEGNDGDDHSEATKLEAVALSAAASGRQQETGHLSSERGRIPRALGSKTIAMSARGVDGDLQYDTHNLYGLGMAAATHAAVATVTGKRPFILSRSTFAGSGAYAAHWSGDNTATWADLRRSVADLLSSNLWGIPMAGSDICGFAGNTTEELCARWISAGAFYTFARSHSSLQSQSQELYRWPAVAAAAKRALGMRYRLLPYLYTAMYEAHVTGGTVARPMLSVSPYDAAARGAVDQWLLGDRLMISPVLEQGQTARQVYFPEGVWYDLWGSHPPIHGPSRHNLNVPVDHVPLHVRGGSILALQKNGSTTAAVRSSPLTLVIALDKTLGLAGSLEQHQACRGSLTVAADSRAGASTSASPSAARSLSDLQLLPAAAEVPEHAPANKQLLVACGQLYMDATGESLRVPDPQGSLLLQFNTTATRDFGQGQLSVTQIPLAGIIPLAAPRLQDITILGLDVEHVLLQLQQQPHKARHRGWQLHATSQHADRSSQDDVSLSWDFSYDEDDGDSLDQFEAGWPSSSRSTWHGTAEADAATVHGHRGQKQQEQEQPYRHAAHGSGAVGRTAGSHYSNGEQGGTADSEQWVALPNLHVWMGNKQLPHAAVRYNAQQRAVQLSADAHGWELDDNLNIEWQVVPSSGHLHT